MGEDIPICQKNVIYQRKLKTHQVLALTFWHTPLANFKMKCFAWCSTESESLQIHDKNFRTLYIQTNQSSNSCENGICHNKQVFKWKNEGSCLATFRCSKLGGEACLKYGMKIAFPQLEENNTFQSVCTENSVLLGKLETNHSVEIDVWYDKEAFANTDCTLWCANRNYKEKQSISTSDLVGIKNILT